MIPQQITNPVNAYGSNKGIQYNNLMNDILGKQTNLDQGAIDNEILQGLISQGIKLQTVNAPQGNQIDAVGKLFGVEDGYDDGNLSYSGGQINIGGQPMSFTDTPVTPQIRNTYNNFDKITKAGYPIGQLGSLKPITDYIGGVDQYSKYMTGIYNGVGGVLNNAYKGYADSNNNSINDYDELGNQIKGYYGPDGYFTKEASNILDRINNQSNQQTALSIARNQGLKSKYGLTTAQMGDLIADDQNKIQKNANDLSSQAMAMNQGIADKLLQYLSPIVQNKTNLQAKNADTLFQLTQQLANNYVNGLISGSPTLKNVSSAAVKSTGSGASSSSNGSYTPQLTEAERQALLGKEISIPSANITKKITDIALANLRK